MQQDPSPKLSAPRDVVLLESKAPPGLSIPPHSGRDSMRSTRPLAASLRPNRSIFPSEDAAAALPARRRRVLGVALVATVGLVALAGALGKHSAHLALTTEIASGRAGLRTTPSGATELWATDAPPAFVLDPSIDRMDPKGGDAKSAIIDGFSTWDSAGLGLPKASFTISSTAGVAAQDGVSRILYAPIKVPGMEDALALTIAYANTATGVIEEADVIFNSKYTFRVFSTEAPSGGKSPADDSVCSGAYDVQNVATHETGHVYGLGEDMQDTTTTMYIRSSPCETHKRALSTPDRQVMTVLYAPSVAAAADSSPSAAHAGGCGGATIASRQPSSGAAAWMACAVAVLVSLRRRRRAA